MNKEDLEHIKIGDKVICLKSYPNLPQEGWKGKVITKEPYLGIEWEKKFVLGHDCGGIGKLASCRNYVHRTSIFANDDIRILKLNKSKQIEFEF